MKEVRFRQTRGDGNVKLASIVMEMDGLSYKPSSVSTSADGVITARFTIPASATGNNSCRLRATIDRSHDNKSHGMVSMLLDK